MLDLRKCTLDPHCRRELKRVERKIELCEDCTKCGWNKDIIIRRMAQSELQEGKKK